MELAVRDYSDLPTCFVIFNMAGSISDIESFLFMFCSPKDLKLSEIHRMGIMGKILRIIVFWGGWREYLSSFCK